jgi:hypothetical protein
LSDTQSLTKTVEPGALHHVAGERGLAGRYFECRPPTAGTRRASRPLSSLTLVDDVASIENIFLDLRVKVASAKAHAAAATAEEFSAVKAEKKKVEQAFAGALTFILFLVMMLLVIVK